MRVQLLSDLHFEFHHDRGEAFVEWLDPSLVDVLILAGDISVAGHLPAALRMLCRHYAQARVLYVHGNHEFYGSTREELLDLTQQAMAENSNLTWLDSALVEIGGIRFLGTPLWFRPDPAALCWRRMLNDFEQIRDFDAWLGPQNQRALDFLDAELRPNDVVITHHLPTERALTPEYLGSPLNPFFVCDVEQLILERQPKTWLFGHTHASHDFRLGATRLVSNPFGYAAHEENQEFDWKRALDL